MLRRHGPLTTAEAAAHAPGGARPGRRLARRARAGAAPHPRAPAGVDPGADVGGDRPQWAAVEDAGRLRDALGVALPVGVPEVFTESSPTRSATSLRRHARTHGPFTAAQVAGRFGIGIAVATDVLRDLERRRSLVSGRLRPEVLGGSGEEYCDTEVLRRMRRRSLAALRAEVEPVAQRALGVFLPRWQGVGRPLRGARRAGARDRAARRVGSCRRRRWSRSCCPPGCVDYSPAMLDELHAAGEVVWAGHAELAAHDGMVSLHPTATADLTLPALAEPEPGGVVDTALHRGDPGGARGRRGVLRAGGRRQGRRPPARRGVGLGGRPRGCSAPGQGQVAHAIWDLVWAGRLTNDGLGPLRARLGSGGRRGTGTAHRTRTAAPRARPMLRGARLGLRPGLGRPPSTTVDVSGHDVGGRWSMLPAREADPTVRAHALAAQLLDRHGVLTRAVAPAEGIAGQFGFVYKVLAALEQAGQVRRGYFVEHLGGSQFALPGAVDQLRADGKEASTDDDDAHDDRPPGSGGRAPATAVVLAATDPANPYGAALAWPGVPTAPGAGGGAGDARTDGTGSPVDGGEGGRHRPGRKAGAVVVLVAGALVLYVERGGRTILSFTYDPERLAVAAAGLADAVRAGRLGRTAIQRANGSELLTELSSPLGRALTGAGFAPTPRGLRLRSPA